MVELFLRVGQGEMRIGWILTTLIKFLGNADTPAVVDDARTAGDQRIPTCLIYRAIVAENDAVFRPRIPVLRTDDLRVKCHTVHLAAVAVTGGDAAYVGPVRAESAVGIHAWRAVIAKCIAFLHRDIGIGIFADPRRDQVDHFVLTAELRVFGIYRLIENTELNAFSGITGGVGLIGVDGPQPPFGIKFLTAPTGGIALLSALYIGRSLRPTDGCQAKKHRAPLGAANANFRPAEGRLNRLDSSTFIFHPRYRPLLFANVLLVFLCNSFVTPNK
ncbi:Uncharacterised protein [Serratia liquefaciens]|nr:Uncharacterised protein [Serratia liquefaciens]